jgi:hypothetical protein
MISDVTTMLFVPDGSAWQLEQVTGSGKPFETDVVVNVLKPSCALAAAGVVE